MINKNYYDGTFTKNSLDPVELSGTNKFSLV